MESDPYLILGVAFDATADEIRAAYLAAAKRLHPDIVGAETSGEQMREVNLAYELLSNPELRARFDREIASDGRANPFEDIEEMVRVWVEEPEFSDLNGFKLRALNREYVRMENEGWAVERKHDHLVCTKTERRSLFSKPRKRRVTVNIDRNGRPFQVEQKLPD